MWMVRQREDSKEKGGQAGFLAGEGARRASSFFKQEKEQHGEDRHTACHNEKSKRKTHDEATLSQTGGNIRSGTLTRTRATRSSLSLTIE